ncbi:toxin-antitoxin system YwqK family antitoxin [Nocardia arizonensis]|uniref:toxin-antitoxin system YwqK family antitoxin n=1 Tax=Nocardia arizonensis TaxID=1141647 RepID=UPI0006D27220|nr:hypothetical protein [Nocardia arizonensis]
MSDATHTIIDISDAALRRDGDLLLYRDEPFTGQTVESYPDGVLRASTSYIDGHRDGVDLGWHPDGLDRYEREFRRGHPALTWRSWYPDGQPESHEIYDVSGHLLFRERWNEDGELVERIDPERAEKGVADDAVDASDPDLAVVDYRTLYRGEPFTGQIYERAYEGSPIVQLRTYVDGWARGLQRGWHLDGGRRYVGTLTDRGVAVDWQEWDADGEPV